MTFLPLNLGVRRSSDAEKQGVSSSRAKLQAQMEKAQKRDNYTCRYCGFRSEHYQRVVAANDDGDASSLVTACTFCEQCVRLERAGMMGSGILIWLPEISQAELNHVARAIYVARVAGNETMATMANRMLDTLMARRADAKKRLGIDDPLILATVMHEMLNDQESHEASAKLEGIRVMPLEKHMVRGPSGDVNQFPQILKYWLSQKGPYARLPVEKWAELFKKATAAVGHA